MQQLWILVSALQYLLWTNSLIQTLGRKCITLHFSLCLCISLLSVLVVIQLLSEFLIIFSTFLLLLYDKHPYSWVAGHDEGKILCFTEFSFAERTSEPVNKHLTANGNGAPTPSATMAHTSPTCTHHVPGELSRLFISFDRVNEMWCYIG